MTSTGSACFKLAILSWTCFQYIASNCPNSVVLTNYNAFDVTSSILLEESTIITRLENKELYTAPDRKNISITFAVKNESQPYIFTICMKTSCVGEIQVKYYGPRKKSSYKDASGNTRWIDERPDAFPEAKYPGNDGCGAKETCLVEPRILTRFSLKFIYANCGGSCSALTIEYVKIRTCSEDIPRPKKDKSSDTCVNPIVKRRLDFSKFIITSTADKEDLSILLMPKKSQSRFVAPSGWEEFNITFEVPDQDSVSVRKIYLETKCVSKILVDYFGPWKTDTFKDVVGNIASVKKSTWYPEEKYIASPCRITRTCFTLPDKPSVFLPNQLSKFSLSFEKQSCSDCNAIMIMELHIE